MCDDQAATEAPANVVSELGSASELTQGSFMPTFYEAINIKDRYDE